MNLLGKMPHLFCKSLIILQIKYSRTIRHKSFKKPIKSRQNPSLFQITLSNPKKLNPLLARNNNWLNSLTGMELKKMKYCKKMEKKLRDLVWCLVIVKILTKKSLNKNKKSKKHP